MPLLLQTNFEIICTQILCKQNGIVYEFFRHTPKKIIRYGIGQLSVSYSAEKHKKFFTRNFDSLI